ncbi:hypothetical protein, partial [Bradyrhizobium sp.]|uniref:hypothetical protein n=1 Tax=Bradyrhizobium sp. TaxID=376 RepID=UPI002E0B1286|nr:hypothetical protein [Bradyrhizobium sp.]
DYYKVVQTGRLTETDNTTAFFVQAHDGIVFNGIDWDVIRINANVVAEAGRASTAEGNIAGNGASEISRATTAEANIAGNVAANFSTLTANMYLLNPRVLT